MPASNTAMYSLLRSAITPSSASPRVEQEDEGTKQATWASSAAARTSLRPRQFKMSVEWVDSSRSQPARLARTNEMSSSPTTSTTSVLAMFDFSITVADFGRQSSKSTSANDSPSPNST